MSRRSFGYVVVLTLVVTLVGAGDVRLENNASDGMASTTMAAPLWWTAMLMTTLGSEYWPQTAEGRVPVLHPGLYAGLPYLAM